MRRHATMLSMLLFVPCAGCAGETVEDALGATNAALVSANALTANALTANALTANALTANALTANALDPSALSALQDPGADGDLARQLLRYVVGCALDGTQSFQFTWTDGCGSDHDEDYEGSIGLAPGWADGPLPTSGQEWVSACLYARVNYYGTPVLISMRGPNGVMNDAALSSDELSGYPNKEGAFWGNLFQSSPTAYACSYGPDDTYSRSRDRDCAAGHVNADQTLSSCGIIERLGSCATHCGTPTESGGYYPSCQSDLADSGTATSHVVTIYLQ